MRNDRQLDRYLQAFKLNLAIDEHTRMPVHVAFAATTEQTQFELFDNERLGPEPATADDTLTEDDSEQKETRAIRNHDARLAIVTAAIDTATTPVIRRRLHGSKPFVIVVEVPSSAWVKPVEDYFIVALPQPWATFTRDGSVKLRDKATVGNDEAARKIADGRHVVGIAVNSAATLPSTLTAAADVTIKIALPTGIMVRKALKFCLRGRLPGHIDDRLVADLGFDDLVAAMRAGSTPKQAVERMRAMVDRRNVQTQTETYPRLEDAVEYGAAQKWGLALARDIQDLREGKPLSADEIDRGAIFFSEPGCGKTWLADSIALACRIPLVKISIGDYFKGDAHLGVVLQEQRAAFERAAALAARNGSTACNGFCLLYIDEIDGLPSRNSLSRGSESGSGSSRNSDWWMPIINDLLLLCDQAKHNHVILCGATNRISAVDPALLRPGRFERAIEITRPSVEGIINILRFHLKADLQADDLTDAARLAEGSTAAELMEIVRGARRRARTAQRALTVEDLKIQIQGEQDVAPALLRRIAIHEAGHAVTTVALAIGELRHVTLQSRAASGGHTRVRTVEEDLMTLSDVENRVVSILSAAVAEKRLVGSKSIGGGGATTSDDGIASSLLSVILRPVSPVSYFIDARQTTHWRRSGLIRSCVTRLNYISASSKCVRPILSSVISQASPRSRRNWPESATSPATRSSPSCGQLAASRPPRLLNSLQLKGARYA
jgi:cell division protease FtsH